MFYGEVEQFTTYAEGIHPGLNQHKTSSNQLRFCSVIIASKLPRFLWTEMYFSTSTSNVKINCHHQQMLPKNEIGIQLRRQAVDCQILAIKTHMSEQIQLVPATIQPNYSCIFITINT